MNSEAIQDVGRNFGHGVKTTELGAKVVRE